MPNIPHTPFNLRFDGSDFHASYPQPPQQYQHPQYQQHPQQQPQPLMDMSFGLSGIRVTSNFGGHQQTFEAPLFRSPMGHGPNQSFFRRHLYSVLGFQPRPTQRPAAAPWTNAPQHYQPQTHTYAPMQQEPATAPWPDAPPPYQSPPPTPRQVQRPAVDPRTVAPSTHASRPHLDRRRASYESLVRAQEALAAEDGLTEDDLVAQAMEESRNEQEMLEMIRRGQSLDRGRRPSVT